MDTRAPEVYARNLITMRGLIQEVIYWNQQRYAQEFDAILTDNLLIEEIEELYAAEGDPIEIMDAVGDILFVSIGVLWKLGLTEEQIQLLIDPIGHLPYFDLTQARHQQMSMEYAALDLVGHIPGSYPAVNLVASGSFLIACGALRGIGMQQHIYKVLTAICVSNASKEVPSEKVDASVKANMNKGKMYTPPTRDLTLLWEQYNV